MTESGTALENPGTGPESYYSTEKADAKRRARLLLYFYGKVWNVGFDINRGLRGCAGLNETGLAANVLPGFSDAAHYPGLAAIVLVQYV